jgi:hypothetical protein
MAVCGPQNRLNILEMTKTYCMWLAAKGTAVLCGLSRYCVVPLAAVRTQNTCVQASGCVAANRSCGDRLHTTSFHTVVVVCY